MGVSAAVHLVRVDDELGGGFVVVLLHAVSQLVDGHLIGVDEHLSLSDPFEDRDRVFNRCYLAFGFDDVLPGLFVLPFEAVGPDEELVTDVTGLSL